MHMRNGQYYNFIIYAVLMVFLLSTIAFLPLLPTKQPVLCKGQQLTGLGFTAREIARNRLEDPESERECAENTYFIGWRRLLRTGMTGGGVLLATGFFLSFEDLVLQEIRKITIRHSVHHVVELCYHVLYMEDTDGEKSLRTA